MESRNPTDYFEAAIRILGEQGEAGVTIAALCDRLGVTKGSFYHHFPSGPAFHAALLEHWERAGAEQLAAAIAGVTDPAEHFATLKRLGLGLDHAAEAAIRAWGRSSPLVAAVQRRVDDGRRRVLAHAFRAAGFEAARAEALADIGVGILVGAQQLHQPLDEARFAAALDEYERWLIASLSPAASSTAAAGASARRRRSSG